MTISNRCGWQTVIISSVQYRKRVKSLFDRQGIFQLAIFTISIQSQGYLLIIHYRICSVWTHIKVENTTDVVSIIIIISNLFLNTLFTLSAACNSTLTSPGSISSSNYPDGYFNNDLCSTTITAPRGKQIRVVFNDFGIEGDTYECYDFLQVYDSDHEQTDKLMGELCGDSISHPVRSSGRNMFLLFSSDFTISRVGYKADVTFEFGTLIKGTVKMM